MTSAAVAVEQMQASIRVAGERRAHGAGVQDERPPRAYRNELWALNVA
jgi:hypothetical protein